MAKHKDDSNKYVDNKKLKEFPKRMPKAQVRLFLGTAKRALEYKNSKQGDKARFTTTLPDQKYAMKYTAAQLEKQAKYLEKLMKETTMREMIRSMVREMLVERPNEVGLNDVRKKGQSLKLKIQIKNVSWGYAGTIHDLKSNLSTTGNVFSKSPEFNDFSKRLKKLKDFVGKQTVLFKGEKVTGLQK